MEKKEETHFELTFWGGAPVRYRRWHKTYEEAEATARRVLGQIRNRNAHPAIIYGPDMGRDGRTVR